MAANLLAWLNAASIRKPRAGRNPHEQRRKSHVHGEIQAFNKRRIEENPREEDKKALIRGDFI